MCTHKVNMARLHSAVLTTSPAVELGLQPGDSIFQRLVLFLLLLPLALPLLCCQLHIETHIVLDSLCPGETERWGNLLFACGHLTKLRGKINTTHQTAIPWFVYTCTSVQTAVWSWSQHHWKRRASSRWPWWSDSSLPASPEGSWSSYCLCTAHSSDRAHITTQSENIDFTLK